MNITLVKKIKSDGNLCRKSADVFEKLKQADLVKKIDHIVFADERKRTSKGLSLAIKHGVQSAPFFIVNQEDGSTQVYTRYYNFVEEVLEEKTSEQESVLEILAQNPDLDFI